MTLVGAGPVGPGDLAEARSLAQVVVAADGGADRVREAGFRPDLVLGDMDSIRTSPPDGVETLAIAEQDTTDFEKCLICVEAPLYLGVGFLDGRLDHTLAAMHALVSHAARRVVLIGGEDIVFATPEDWRGEVSPGTRFSLFPVTPCKGLGSEGLRWPIAGLDFAATRQIGTSNEVIATPVSTSVSGPGLVTILPKRCLPGVIESLRD